jgi:phosphohistidine phosphatase
MVSGSYQPTLYGERGLYHSMEIYLVRHAKSAHGDEWESDLDRPLTKKGRKKMAKMAKVMCRRIFSWNEVWVSPAVRARQTLDIIKTVCRRDAPEQTLEELLGEQDPQLIFQALQALSDANPKDRILIVGHNPHISALLALLVPSTDISMKTGEIAWVIWDEQGVRLQEYLTKKDL